MFTFIVILAFSFTSTKSLIRIFTAVKNLNPRMSEVMGSLLCYNHNDLRVQEYFEGRGEKGYSGFISLEVFADTEVWLRIGV